MLIDHNPPRLIYERPADAWVAEFFGDANILTGRELASLTPAANLLPEARYLIRPEALEIAAVGADASLATATVGAAVYYGAFQVVHLTLANGLELRARHTGIQRLREGDFVGIRMCEGIEPYALPR
jgi:ABC-type Fe3+/spermidine/putrescine transport system ATPase subunit